MTYFSTESTHTNYYMNCTETPDCRACVQGWDNFKNLSESELELVNQNRFEASFKVGETVFKQGGPCSNTIFLKTGIGKVYLEGFEGKRVILNFVKPGRMIIGPGLYVDNRHNYSLSALTDMQVCFVDSKILKELIAQNPKFAEGYIRHISIKAQNNHTRLFNLTQKKMHGRLAEGLLYLSEKLFTTNDFNCIMTRQELGEFTNMSKESVVRILNKFNSENIIDINHTRIKILDKKKLEQISYSG